MLTALIPSRLLRLLVSFLNILQVRPQGIFTALINYTDLIKTTKYYSLQYKYPVEDRLSYLHILNKKASGENAVPCLPEAALTRLAETQSTIQELAVKFQEEFLTYKTAFLAQLQIEQYQAVKSEWISSLQEIVTTFLEWSPYIILGLITAITGYKIYNYFAVIPELALPLAQGIEIQQQLNTISQNVQDLAAIQQATSRVVQQGVHPRLITLAASNAEAHRVLINLTSEVAQHNFLLAQITEFLQSGQAYHAVPIQRLTH